MNSMLRIVFKVVDFSIDYFFFVHFGVLLSSSFRLSFSRVLLSHDISLCLFGYHWLALGSYSRIGFSIPLFPNFDIRFFTLWVSFEVLSIFSEFFNFFLLHIVLCPQCHRWSSSIVCHLCHRWSISMNCSALTRFMTW